MSEIKKIEIKNVVFRNDLYPRFEPNQAKIQEYADALESLPPIEVNQNNILIDGYHRWKAHQLQNQRTIKVIVTETTSESELEWLAIERNCKHGLQLSPEEKRIKAIKFIEFKSVKEIAKWLSVNERTVEKWTELQRKTIKEQRNKQILSTYLNARYTQEQIAEMFRVPQRTISDILSEKRIFSEIAKDFSPPLYNIWNLQKRDNTTTSHFGSFPLYFMKSLLFYHTKPFDIVFDPFAGGGTTVDACKSMMRRYFCTDRIVRPGRENDIYEHDINKGLPDKLPKPDLVFLDPPYWKQAENKYSDSEYDLGNMELDNFYSVMNNLLKTLSDRKVEKIALVIQPTQYKNNLIFEDHIFKFNSMVSNKYCIEMRYILPYSTQQYTPQIVTKAKEENICLCLNRDLIVWRLIK